MKGKKKYTVKRVCLIVLALMLSAGMACTALAKGKGNKKKKQTSQPVRVAVVDLTYKAAAGTIRYAKYCGMKPVWVKTTKINPKNYDGLLVPGGGDVHPKIYGAKKIDRHVYGTNWGRSKLQIGVIKRFAAAGKPVLGICGGEQTINVAFGGTLKQHIGWHTYWHAVRIAKGSWLRSVFGATPSVYHFHHQCVGKLGKGLKATMWAMDIHEIEGIEHQTLPIYGVQWHPDQMGSRGKKVGRKFMAICRKYRKK